MSQTKATFSSSAKMHKYLELFGETSLTHSNFDAIIINDSSESETEDMSVSTINLQENKGENEFEHTLSEECSMEDEIEEGSNCSEESDAESVSLGTPDSMTDSDDAEEAIYIPKENGNHYYSVENGGKLEVFNDDNFREFNSLRNSEVDGNKLVLDAADLLGSKINYTFYDDVRQKQIFPGVNIGVFHKAEGISHGLIKICPRTIKPFERDDKANIVFTVVEGEIIVKSSSFQHIGNKKVLTKKEVGPRTTFSIPAGVIYALENRKDSTAVLQFVVCPTK